MKLLRPIAIAARACAAGSRRVRADLADAVRPRSAAGELPAKKEAPKRESVQDAPKPKRLPCAKKPATPKPAATPTPRARRPPPAFDDPNVDLVYGAYQRGL